MNTAVLLGPEKIKFMKKPIPRIGPNEVLVKVKVCGVCGSDISYYERGKTESSLPPIILGHEFTGEIVKLGNIPETLGLNRVNDRIVVEPAQSCGVCWACKNAMPNLCTKPTVLGVSVDGGFAEYCKVHYNYVHPLPENISFKEGAFVEPLACALYGIGKMRITPGDFCIVIGPGSIGLMMTQFIKASGVAGLALIGTRDYRLEIGKQLGADYIINTKDETSKYYTMNPVEKIMELTDNKGANAIIVAVGNSEANQLATRLGGARSRTVFFGGAGYKPEDFIKLNLWEGTSKDKEFIFSWLAPYTFSKALRSLETGLVKVEPLITHTYTLEETDEAIKTAKNRIDNAIKVQVEIDH
jgi:L-iditol 2-dehydrogenase